MTELAKWDFIPARAGQHRVWILLGYAKNLGLKWTKICVSKSFFLGSGFSL